MAETHGLQSVVKKKSPAGHKSILRPPVRDGTEFGKKKRKNKKRRWEPEWVPAQNYVGKTITIMLVFYNAYVMIALMLR